MHGCAVSRRGAGRTNIGIDSTHRDKRQDFAEVVPDFAVETKHFLQLECTPTHAYKVRFHAYESDRSDATQKGITACPRSLRPLFA